MNPNIKPSHRVGILGAVNPQSVSTVQTSGWIKATDFANFLAVVGVGALGASATVDAKIEQANTSGGGGAKDVTGKVITQLTKVGTDDNKQVLINLRQADLDFANGFAWFRLSITPATAACLIYGLVFGLDQRNGLASDNDAATVDEIV